MDICKERVTGQEGGMRLDAFWQEKLEGTGIARNRLQSWIKDGRARVDGLVCTKSSTKVLPGQVLELEPEAVHSDIIPDAGPLEILYADDHLAIIDKQPGLIVHPAPSVTDPTLVHRAAHHFPALLLMPGERPGIVHRLDKDTSGIIMLALDDSTRLALSSAFAEREVVKEYLAIVAGVPKEYGRVTLPLGRHPSIKTRMAVAEKGGRDADTEYWRIWTTPDRSASLVRVRIHTGRTHQIRVHLASEGHPLLGDSVYADTATADRAPRQMLHSWHLQIEHPVTQEPLEYLVPPPQDFMDVLQDLCLEGIHVGLTGVTGCGKSTVRQVFAAQGVPVFNADEEVARSYKRGQDGWKILRHHFGTKFVPSDAHDVDKAVLLAAMQRSESMRREIERLIHPVVRHALHRFLSAHPKQITLAEIPLLFEAGFDTAQGINTAVTVYCPEEVRAGNLAERGWSEDRILAMDVWQWSQERKIRQSHLVLDNSGTLADCEARARDLLQVLRNLQEGRVARQMDVLIAFMNDPAMSDEDGEEDVAPA